MARLPRVYVEGVLYYVTSRSGHSQDLFVDQGDYKEYVALVDKYKKQYGFKLYSYALLPTHLHMLIELKNNIGISNIMHDVNSLYTKIFNARYGGKGHLFQQRFNAVFAEKGSYLLQLARHIHQNPVRESIVREAREYPYSSYPQYLDPEKRKYPDLKDEVEEVFRLLKGREAALEEYTSGGNRGETNDLKKEMRRNRFLGSAEFGDKLRDIMDENVRRAKEAKASRRGVRVMYLAIGGAIILVLSVSVGYFYRRTAALKTEYDQTAVLYRRTLDMLKRERDRAIRANENAGEYAWKIRLTEQALEEVKEAASKKAQEEGRIEGFAWRVEFTPMDGAPLYAQKPDTIYFTDNRVVSNNLSQEGFGGSNYARTDLKNGTVVWETMQTNRRGESAAWHGEWDGSSMRGVMSRRFPDGTARNYTFASTGEKIKKK